jgi:hypothetical protein
VVHLTMAVEAQSPARPAPYLRRHVPANLLDYLLFWPGIWLACALGPGLRLLGALFLLIPLFCLLYALLQRVMMPRLLGLYVLFCILVAVLSKYELFPHSWQTHFLPEAIIRQIVPTLSFFMVSWAAKAYFRRQIRHGYVLSGANFVLFFSFGAAFLTMYILDRGYQGDYSLYEKLAMFGSFLNNSMIGMFYVTYYIYFSRGWRRYCGTSVVVAIAAITHFIQFRLWAAATLLIAFGVPARKVAIGVITALISAYAVAMYAAPQLMRLDPNDGLRAVMMRDAISSVWDTDGIGIGYGKESVKARYSVPGMPDFTFLPDWNTMTRERLLEALSSSVENSYIMTLLRTGIFGFALLVAAISTGFPPRDLPPDTRRHAAALFTLGFVASFVNAGFDTPLQVVGHGFIYGYLLALRASWKSLARTRSALRAMPPQESLTTVDVVVSDAGSDADVRYSQVIDYRRRKGHRHRPLTE